MYNERMCRLPLSVYRSNAWMVSNQFAVSEVENWASNDPSYPSIR